MSNMSVLAPAEEEEIRCGAENGEDRDDVLVDVGAGGAARNRQDDEEVGEQKERLRRGRCLQVNHSKTKLQS